MPDVFPLDLRQFVVKEHVGFLRLADVFDIFDAQTLAKVALARETPGGLIHTLRFLINKKLLPNRVTVTQGDETGPLLFCIRKPFTFLRSKVWVEDASGKVLGTFKSKMFSLGGGFWVHNEFDQPVAEVKGDWKGWNFQFRTTEGKELGLVTKKWGGLAKELFTSADTYAVSIHESAGADRGLTILLLAACLAVDIIYKERG
ncbi:MAG TPA: phospholipid scramblase-related protein [Planctomycetota bacterium]|nr:phospholipid scramblase-related protein [Planctomycetota bacterium]